MSNPNTDLEGIREQLIKWPSDIDSDANGQGMMFHIFQYSKEGTESKERSQAKESIVLPIPARLEHSDQHNWQNVDSQLVSGALEAYNQRDQSWSAVMKAGAAAIQGFTRQAFGEEVSTAVSAQTGRVNNPREMVGFERTSFKTHSFSFKMIPRNADESQAIHDIVNTFREYSHPEPIGGDSAFQYRIPHIFRIEFMPKELNGILYRPGDSILQSVSVSYGEEGGVQLFEGTNHPVETTITLEFQEMFVKTAKTIRQEAQR